MEMRLPRWFILLVLLLVLLGFGWLLQVRLTTAPAQALAQGQQLLAAKRVLALVAHPDDLEWYVGGTLHLLANAGADVEVIVASDGEQGPNRTHAPDLRAARRAEQERAGQINGYTQIHFLGLPDRLVAAEPELTLRVAEIYQQLKPEAVFIFDPDWPAYPYLHADHQGSAQAFMRFWEKLPAQGRPPVYLFQTRQPDTAVDISTVIDAKVQAMDAHVSQGGGGTMLRRVFAADGRLVGVPYAELFRTVRGDAQPSGAQPSPETAE